MSSTSRAALSTTRSPQRKARARRAPVARPPVAPVDAFAERLAHADALARQLLRRSVINPAAGVHDCEIDYAIANLAGDDPEAAPVEDPAVLEALRTTNFAAYEAYEDRRLGREIALTHAAYLLGVAVGRRLAPGVSL